MPIFEVQTPDGRTFEVEAPDLETAAQSAQEFAGGAPAQPSQAEMLQEQAGTIPGSGIVRSIANLATPEGRENAGRSLQVGTQGVGRGVADLVGLPGDLANAIFDLPLQAADLAAEQFGGNVDFRFGPSPVGGDAIASGAGDVVEAIGGDIIKQDEMSPGERAAYNINRFGTEATAGGGALARTAMIRFAPGTRQTPAFGDVLLRPYADDAARTFRGDVGAGAGAGAGLTYSQENDLGPIGDLVAMIMGGVGGATLTQAPETIARTGRNVYERATPDPEIPLDENLRSTSRRVSRRASEMAQTMADDPAQAAETISRRATVAEGGPVATTGLLSGDTGLVAAEQGVRVKSPEQFRKSDTAVGEHASGLISGLEDPTADLAAPARSASQARRDRIAPVEQQRAAVETAYNQAEAARRAQGAPLQSAADTEARAAASGRVHSAVVEPYTQARTAKNEAFDALDPQRTQQVDATDVIAAAERVRASVNELAPSGLQMPGEFMGAIERLAPDIRRQDSSILDASGTAMQRDVNVGGPGTAALGDLVEVRKYLSTAHENARRSGNFTLADNIGELRRTINETIERTPEAAAANEQYRDFADRFRPGASDEGARFTREIDRGREPEPSKTAGRFLSSPERTAALGRMAEGGEETGVRDFLRSDFASRVLTPEGTVRPDRADAWLRDNADTLSQYPNARQEFDQIAAQARRGETLSKDAKQRLDEATKAVADQERTFDRSILGDVASKDPRDVAKKVISGDRYASGAEMDEITQAIGSDPEAARGWRAAVAEVLSDKVRNTSGDLAREGAEGPVSIAKLRRTFGQHEEALSGVFSEEDMGVLRRAHEALSPLENRRAQATVGSQTAENAALAGAWDALGTAMTFKYGAVHAGMVMHRVKRMLNLVPGLKERTLDNQALELVNRMWFDPDLAKHLLEADVDQFSGPGWNKKLQALLVGGEAVRDGDEAAEPSLEETIMDGAR